MKRHITANLDALSLGTVQALTELQRRAHNYFNHEPAESDDTEVHARRKPLHEMYSQIAAAYIGLMHHLVAAATQGQRGENDEWVQDQIIYTMKELMRENGNGWRHSAENFFKTLTYLYETLENPHAYITITEKTKVLWVLPWSEARDISLVPLLHNKYIK